MDIYVCIHIYTHTPKHHIVHLKYIHLIIFKVNYDADKKSSHLPTNIDSDKNTCSKLRVYLSLVYKIGLVCYFFK